MRDQPSTTIELRTEQRNGLGLLWTWTLRVAQGERFHSPYRHRTPRGAEVAARAAQRYFAATRLPD